MKKILVIVLVILFFQEVKSERIVTDILHLKTISNNDSVLNHTFLLYRVAGDKIFEKTNKEVIQFFDRNVFCKNDSLVTDSLSRPILYYKSVFLNDWEDKGRGKLYCHSALKNLSLICLLSGDVLLLRRLIFSLESEINPVLNKEFVAIRKFRKKSMAFRYSVY